MKHFLKHTTKKQWGFMGLAGLMLLAGLLLGEGQAKTVSHSHPFATNTYSEILKPDTPGQTVSPARLQQKLNKSPEKSVAEKDMGLKSRKEKKKAGLAILFLGVLAKKS